MTKDDSRGPSAVRLGRRQDSDTQICQNDVSVQRCVCTRRNSFVPERQSNARAAADERVTENDPKQGAQESDVPHQRIRCRNVGYRAQGDQDRRESARQQALPHIADNVRYDKTRKEGAPMWPRESSWPTSPAGTAAHTTNPTAAALRSWRAATSVGVRPAALACWSHPQLVKVGADPQARSAW